MAGGWARDGAVQDQIDDTVSDAVSAARARMPKGEGPKHCDECGEPIPEKRRTALPAYAPVSSASPAATPPCAKPASTAAAARTASCADASLH